MTLKENRSKGPPWWRSCRYGLAILACIGYANFFLQRINLSMAVVCMVNYTALDAMTSHGSSVTYGLLKIYNNSGGLSDLEVNRSRSYGLENEYWANETSIAGVDITRESQCNEMTFSESQREDGELLWSKEMQGIVLGGLYWGYALCQFPSQRIIQVIGVKRSALYSVLVMSVLTMLCPIAARTGSWYLMAVRILQGVASALGVPAIYAMWGQWAPPQERVTLMGICFSGSLFANAIIYPTSGLLCKYGFAGGWPSIFYVFGTVGLVWCPLWMVFAYETPHSHPWITPAEREYIENSIGHIRSAPKGSIPWLKILSQKEVWAVVIAQLGYNWPFFMLLAVLPQYMKEVLKFDIQSNGFYTMMPFLCLGILTNVWAVICQKIQQRKLLSVTNIRKLSTAVGDVIPAALYISLSFLDCNESTTVVILMTVAIGISGTNLQGFLINPYDIAPRYATAVLSLSNTVSVASGILSPYLVAFITKDKTREQWQTVFFLTVVLNLVCMVFYLIFGSGKEMEWQKVQDPLSSKNGEVDMIIEASNGHVVNDTKENTDQEVNRNGNNKDVEKSIIIEDEISMTKLIVR